MCGHELRDHGHKQTGAIMNLNSRRSHTAQKLILIVKMDQKGTKNGPKEPGKLRISIGLKITYQRFFTFEQFWGI